MRHRLKFEVNYIKWYLVDMTDYHHPVLVRKHLNNKEEAKTFKKLHYPTFEIIKGKEAIKLNIKDWHNGKPKHRHRKASKYEYPSHIKTLNQQKIYRGNRRRAMKNKPPKLTYDVVKDILKGKPIFFITKRVTKFLGNHWGLSEPVPGYKKITDLHGDYPDMVRIISNICRALMKYYDCGVYRETDVAIEIFDYWGDLAMKFFGGVNDIPTDHEKIAEEFIARGFVEAHECDLDENDNYACSIHITPTLYYPEQAYHTGAEMKLYEEYVYNLQSRVRITGYTKAHVAGLSSRK